MIGSLGGICKLDESFVSVCSGYGSCHPG